MTARLEQQTAIDGFETDHAGCPGPTCERHWSERFTAIAVRIVANDQITGDQKHFFPVVVDKRFRLVRARREAQETRLSDDPTDDICPALKLAVSRCVGKPRYDLALQLLWRRVADSAAP